MGKVAIQTWIALSAFVITIFIILIIKTTNPLLFSPSGYQFDQLEFGSLDEYLTAAPELTSEVSDQEILDLIDNEIIVQGHPSIIVNLRNTLTDSQTIALSRGTNEGIVLANNLLQEEADTLLDFINNLFNNLP
ncbi:hypothetical protein COU60_05270 [Candidatus Pacearchaeota archaeon CG10_big_fil_rev_8_21_14_0_10_34_76]|nr:MAG: hypothetical protein COU60_05270 [Candidatus Pacearchaeota archaeon CG10_big_fil_rev_8_21_14_0_10_34_76]